MNQGSPSPRALDGCGMGQGLDVSTYKAGMQDGVKLQGVASEATWSYGQLLV